ncbi:hypothetical protein BRC62_04685 [Halobacteriales archaeon QH_10_67_13]|nr:MAG: hypothetical protein BRC62_04685 [Halobacteriales archaeon QH_10_67_13]
MDRQRLRGALGEFAGSDEAIAVVARQAADLLASGRLKADLGIEPTAETIRRNLADAPEDSDVIERWNWWMGSLELSHGGYLQFRVRTTP